MSRTRAEALALVNWKGVFYERYLLDENVTAMEGTNGAGKTTVMIAAYVVLLPDMSRLRFSNLGESAATGGDKGIYGRLGDPDSPSYAAIDFRLGGDERLLAGVHMDRRSEPSVELTPFVVSGLGDDIALQDLLLDRGDLDVVPDLNRLRELVALGGGRIKTFTKNSDYFADLFDRGVTPLRLTGDEERTKLNEMLRTSMVGGISRALTGGLREFLLKAETGLADTLKRMRGNLDACRRTRIEVEAAQRMEEEIHGVYEAGQEMFVAAVHATRERADELHQRLQRAEAALEAADTQERKLAAVFAEKTEAHEVVKAELTRVRGELEEARRKLDSVRVAHGIASRIAGREAERINLASEAKRAREIQRQRRAHREQSRCQRAQAQAEVKSASLGLADFQQGLDELHRRASAFEQVSRRLAEARRGLPSEDVRPVTVGTLRRDCERRVARADGEIVRLDRTIATAKQRRTEYEHVTTSLVALTGDAVDPKTAMHDARSALTEIRALESSAAELPELPARIEEARKLAEKQQRVRQAAENLATAEYPLGSATDVQEAFAAADAKLETTRQQLVETRAAQAAAARQREQADSDIAGLEPLLLRWKDVQTRAVELGEILGGSLQARTDIETLQDLLVGERDRLREQHREVQSRHDELVELADQLEHSGGQFSGELLRARDAVEGELLAGHFDDVSVEEAPRFQAVLGPLADAIVVDDSSRAARILANMADCPASVWLVDETTTLTVDARRSDTERLVDSVLVPGTSGSRLTKLPEQPTLGHRARTQRVRSLRNEIAKLDEALRNLIAGQRKVSDSIASAGSLMADSALLERSDPATDLEDARQRHDKAVTAERECLDKANDLDARIGELMACRESLRGILSDAHMLDPPDHRDAVQSLELRQTQARAAQDRLNAVADHIATVEDGIDVLRVPPPSDADLESHRAELDAARTARDRLSGVLDALRYMEANLPALGWSDAPTALAAEQALRPALDEQLRLAEAELQRSEAAEEAAERSLEHATEEAQKAQAGIEQLDAALTRDREELTATKVEDPSDEALATAERRHEELRQRSSTLDNRERSLGGEAIEAKVRHESQAEKVESLRKERDDEDRQWRPIAERWRKLQEEADEAGVLRSAMTPAIIERTRSAGSVNLYQDARTKGEILTERLGRSEGGKEGAEAISAWLAQASQDVGLAYLRAWLDAREWLRRRVPPQIAEVDDPLETLARVRDHLGRLRERLGQQEKNLRGQSEDVARNIETQRRKARREVSRLNQELRSVRFGSIHGVQIQVRPVESRERVLQALREGEAQQLLFQSEMPIEEAMAELFKRYGGGQTGGQRLLDYREYLDLQVEIRRQESSQWERANPTRMSTGEAIGVGAAIMMVVLTAWERHANLLRAKRSAGTLRLLFLDEANRLSQDNLTVLFELCQNLELQLLIAAPEVAQSKGNTTYHLVRQVDDSGQEIVRVTGRRTLRGGR